MLHKTLYNMTYITNMTYGTTMTDMTYETYINYYYISGVGCKNIHFIKF